MSLLTFADLYAVKYTERTDMDSITEEGDSSHSNQSIHSNHSNQPTGEEIITVSMFHALPPIKFHDGPLQFLSKSQLTAKEYARRLSAAR